MFNNVVAVLQQCRDCGDGKPKSAFSAASGTRCQDCWNAYSRLRNEGYRECGRCRDLKPKHDFDGRKRTCRQCLNAPTRVCSECKQNKPAVEFRYKRGQCQDCFRKLARERKYEGYQRKCVRCSLEKTQADFDEGKNTCRECVQSSARQCSICGEWKPQNGVWYGGRCQQCIIEYDAQRHSPMKKCWRCDKRKLRDEFEHGQRTCLECRTAPYRKCRKCRRVLPAEFFYRRKEGRCLDCRNEYGRRYHAVRYHSDPPYAESVRRRARERYHRNYRNPVWRQQKREYRKRRYRIRRASDPDWVEQERTRSREYSRRRRQSDPSFVEGQLEAGRRYRLKHRTGPEFRRKENRRQRTRYQNNPAHRDKAKLRTAKRKALKRETAIGAIPPDIRDRLMRDQIYRCRGCGRSLKNLDSSKIHLDHIQPLSSRRTGRRGTHSVDNLCLLCWKCNGQKNDKDPDQFAREIGRLFF